MKKEIPYIHLIRVFACLMVILLHSASGHIFIDAIDKYYYTFINGVTRPCVPLFFMITGALILPSELSMFEFYKKRIPRIAYPLLFWAAIYAFFYFVISDQSISDFFRKNPFSFPFHGEGILWYLYMLIGIYFIIPFINAELFVNRQMMIVYICIWFVSTITPFMHHYQSFLLGYNYWEHNFDMFVYFTGYFGYLLLGFFLSKNDVNLLFGKTCSKFFKKKWGRVSENSN